MDQDGSIRSIARALTIMREINRAGSIPLIDIAQRTDIPYPTTVRIVRALVFEGVIEREPSRKWYRPTALAQGLANGFQNDDRLVTNAREEIVDLTRRLLWPISIETRVGNVMVVRDSTSPLTAMTYSHCYPGWQIPLFGSASGRAFLAHASQDLREDLRNFYQTHGSQVEIANLRTFEAGDAENIRMQGFSVVARPTYAMHPGKVSSISVPVFERAELLGTMSLIFFASALTMTQAIERFAGPMQETAAAIGRKMALRD
jgi:IclR family mhp operon transcriptional activator